MFFFILLAPFIAFATALLRAAVLFWPTMVFIGALHSYVPIVPALGWQATCFLLMVVGLLFGPANSFSDD